MVSPQNIHTGNIIQTEHVILMYLGVFTERDGDIERQIGRHVYNNN